MSRTAGSRFWRGVREPWELLGRMRHVRPLWSRYWRTVLLQAGLALVAGLAVFWLGKQGADAWNDAFGPDELAESSAPATAGEARSSSPGAPASAAGKATASTSTEGAPGGAGLPSAAEPSSADRPAATPRGTTGGPRRTPPSPPSPPPPGAPAAAPPQAPAPPRASAPGAGPAAGEEEDAAEADTDEEDAPVDEEALESRLEEKINALQNAPAEERGKRTAELVAAALEKAKKEAARAERRAGKKKGQAGEAAEELADDREALTEKLGALTLAAEALAKETPGNVGKARRARRSLERELDKVEKEARGLERRGAAPLSAAESARLERARAALQLARRHERGLAGRLGAVLALLAAIYASLGIAQTGILALSRDFHDALSRELSLLVHVAPEDPPMRPKVRLDLPWVRRKAKRRARFFLGFLPGTALITVVGWLVPPHRTLTTVLTALWAAYWWMVMTAALSARAWTPPETTQRPWYLRAWFKLTERVFLFRVALGWWGRIWERLARNFYGPAERVEEQPLEFAGLALSRAVLLIPVVKLLFRPVFPVCAARLLVEHAATARLPIPVTAAEVADAAAHAPDPEARAHSGVAS